MSRKVLTYRLQKFSISFMVAVTLVASYILWVRSRGFSPTNEGKCLKLENGVPTDDTFQRIFAIIKPEQLEKCFRNWVKSVFETEENEIISLDGKTICGSRMDDYSFIHMVSAWANQAGIVLGQIRVDDKSNEITAVPKLLDLIEVENCVFTSDAMSCQKKTVG